MVMMAVLLVALVFSRRLLRFTLTFHIAQKSSAGASSPSASIEPALATKAAEAA